MSENQHGSPDIRCPPSSAGPRAARLTQPSPSSAGAALATARRDNAPFGSMYRPDSGTACRQGGVVPLSAANRDEHPTHGSVNEQSSRPVCILVVEHDPTMRHEVVDYLIE